MAAGTVFSSDQLLCNGYGGGRSPYEQNGKIAFAPRIIACLAALTALLDLAILGGYYLDPVSQISPKALHNYLEVAKWAGIVAGGATAIGLIRDIYATSRTWIATHNSQETRKIAKTEMLLTLGSLPFSFVLLWKNCGK